MSTAAAPEARPQPRPAAVIDVGGSGSSVWRLDGDRVRPILRAEGRPDAGVLRRLAVAAMGCGGATLLATPGQMDPDGHIVAGNLGWDAVDLGAVMDVDGHDLRWVNDAMAIAAGERTLHGLEGRVLTFAFGTGLGVAVADRHGSATLMGGPDVEAGHLPAGGADVCAACGQTGCLETVARAWMSDGSGASLLRDGVARVAENSAADAVVVCGGALRSQGAADRLTALLRPALRVPLLTSAVRRAEKSAAPHGAVHLWAQAVRLW